jgi:Protein of unknown function DUF2617
VGISRGIPWWFRFASDGTWQPGNLARQWPGRTVMSVSFLRPRVSDLVFQLYGRPLHPELFDIRAVRKIQRDGYELTVRITRTGHVISWENRDVHLTEIAAAHDEPLPEKRRLLSYRLRQEHNATLACAHGIHYQMSFQVEVLPLEIFLHVHDEILDDGSKRGLLHNFQPHHRLALAPLSLVTVESRAGCLFLSAFHTFPDEHTVVKTQSLIEQK